MSYTRIAAATYVASEHTTLLGELGVDDTDEAGGIKSILDRSFRALGIAESDLRAATVDDSQTRQLEAVLDYYAILRFWRESAVRVQISKRTAAGSAVAKNREQLYDHLTVVLADALSRANALGLSVGVDEFEIGALNLDILEPAVSPLGARGDGFGWSGGWWGPY